MENLNMMEGKLINYPIPSEGPVSLFPKPYLWHIPEEIQGTFTEGNMVIVSAAGKKMPTLVTNIFHLDEEAARQHKDVIHKAKQENLDEWVAYKRQKMRQ